MQIELVYKKICRRCGDRISVSWDHTYLRHGGVEHTIQMLGTTRRDFSVVLPTRSVNYTPEKQYGYTNRAIWEEVLGLNKNWGFVKVDDYGIRTVVADVNENNGALRSSCLKGRNGTACKKSLNPSTLRICSITSSHFSERMRCLCIWASNWVSRYPSNLTLARIPMTMQDVRVQHLLSQVHRQVVY